MGTSVRRQLAIIGIPAALCAAAFALGGDSAPTPEAALARARAKGIEMLNRLPNYTCREKVQRFSRLGAWNPWTKQDELELEVARVAGKELFAAPGKGFGETDPARIASKGTIASGDFTGHLNTLFAGGAAKVTYHGRTNLEGRPALRYDFRTPPAAGWTLRDGITSAPVGESGSFWVDAKTFDLLRVVVEADHIPAELLITGTTQRIDYARTRIAGREELLPREAELIVTQAPVAEGLPRHDRMALQQVQTRNLVEFSGCREYQAEAVISFNEPPHVEIPAGVSLDARLETDLDSKRVMVGEGLVAKLENAISKGGKVIVPAGALLKGRVSTVTESNEPGSKVVGLEFSEVEFGGQRAQFSGELKTVEPGAADVVVAPQQMERPGAVTFRVPGAGVSLKGLRMSWRTLGSTGR
jgi:hypothetical protein